MHNFVFHNPTKVLFGRDTIASVGLEAQQIGRKVLLVHGRKSARRSGLLDRVISLLTQVGAVVELFGEVQANPTLAHVHQGIRIAKAFNPDLICGLGGGSVIDSAKAIAAGALVEHDVWKFFTGKKSVKASLPVIAISTVAASGSEMNSGMVLTNDALGQKFGFAHRLLFPRVAIMDPETTYTVSREQTGYGTVDALAHLLEFYLTTSQAGTTVQDRYMEGLASAIVEGGTAALADPCDYEARASLMWAAGLALGGLSAAGLGKVGFPMHLIEHSLSALYDVPHGAGLAVVIPGWLKFHASQNEIRIRTFLTRALGLAAVSSPGVNELIDDFEQWLVTLGLPTTLDDLDIPASAIESLAENSQPLARIWRMREYDIDRVSAILQLCCKKNDCFEASAAVKTKAAAQ